MAVADQTIIDLAVEENFSPSKEFLLNWDSLGTWQFEILKDYGLTPHHKLLDIGCGPLRLGLMAVPYLHEGHYVGVDALDAYLRIGRQLLNRAGVEKSYRLQCDSEFDFSILGMSFDYAMAQSVFTHLSTPEITKCIHNLADVMKPQGLLLFTYILSNKPMGKLYGGTYPMQISALPDSRLFEAAAAEAGATFEAVNGHHPTGQSVGLLRFVG